MSLHRVLAFHLSIYQAHRLHETFSTGLLDPIVKVVVKGLFGVNDMNTLSPHELRTSDRQPSTASYWHWRFFLYLRPVVESFVCWRCHGSRNVRIVLRKHHLRSYVFLYRYCHITDDPRRERKFIPWHIGSTSDCRSSACTSELTWTLLIFLPW